MTLKYDDSSWHFEAEDFPTDIPESQSGVHIGMFLAWAFLNDGASDLHKTEDAADFQKVKNRQMTGTEFLFKCCDGKLLSADLSTEMNGFADFYWVTSDDAGHEFEAFFEAHPDDDAAGNYLEDYSNTLAQELPSLYHVKDTWQNFDRIAPLITKRFLGFKKLIETQKDI